MNLTIILAVVLLFVVGSLIFRMQVVIDIIKGNHKKRVDPSNGVNAILFPIMLVTGLAAFAWSAVSASKFYLPEAASEYGKQQDMLFDVTMVVIILVFVLVHMVLFMFPFMYQFKEDRKAKFYPDNHKLELLWTIIPAIVLATLIFSGWRVWTKVTDPAPKNHVTLEIIGKQFNWMVRYPGMDQQLGKHNFRRIDANNVVGIDFADKNGFDDFMVSEIHIPKGRPVEFKIRALDVLHSVFAIHFRQKMDAVPGMPTSFWFTPTMTTQDMRDKTGNPKFDYEIACTEVCGKGHFSMKYKIVVDEPEDFEKWYAEQKSFLSKNPEYLAQVPDGLKGLAKQQLPAEAAAEPAPAADTTAAPAAAAPKMEASL